MKLSHVPKLSRGKPRRPGPGNGVQVPRFAEDLYRDLRDRRLLLPALLLLAAIAAVPLLLATGREEPPTPLAFTPPEGSEAVAPAVLADVTVGVRDYRKRLDELKSKNPFASKFSFPDEAGAGDGAAAASAPTTPADVPTGNAPGVPNNDTGAPTGPGTPPGAATPSTGGGDGGDQGAGEALILAPRVDVRAGKPGELRPIRGVALGDILPHPRKAPVAILLSARDNLRYVTFLVSNDVTATNGDGKCRPSPGGCQFLRMKAGDRQKFVFGPDEAVRVIRVKAIREKIVDRRKVEDK